MSKQTSKPQYWHWIMGGITLLVALFFPPIEQFWRIQGFIWQLLEPYFRIDFYTILLLLFPPCALTICMIWFWRRQMYWHPTIWRGLLVALEALLVALLATAVFNIAIFVIPFLGNGWGMAFALFNALRAGAVFLVFSPCLLLAAAVVAHLQASSFSIPRP